MRTLAKILGGLVVLIIGIAVIFGDNDTPPVDVAVAAAPVAEAEDSDFRVLQNGSYCRTDPADARLYVFVTVRNNGATGGDFNVRPWRRYSDGSENDSAMDTLTITVPAHSTKHGWAQFNYNALDHELLECGVYAGSSVDVTPLEVR